MKHIFYMILACSVIGLFSCQEDEVETWHGEDGVYFYVQWGVDWYDTTYWAAQPYTEVNFTSLGEDTSVVKLRVMLAGNIADYDRQFRFVLESDSTTAVEGANFLNNVEEYQVLKAGERYTDIYITVMNTDVLADEELRIGYRLLPTEDLTLACPVWEDFSGMLANAAGLEQFDGAYHTIRLNDFITRPNGWVGLPMPDVAQVGDQEAGLLGIFTREKFNYILEVVPGLTYEDFESSTTMPTARARAIGDLVAISLQEAFDSGNPVYEADGRLMWVMGVSWDSYWGVPYVQGN